MKRNTLALAAGVALALGSSVMITADASFVKTSATLMMQGQATSRWQPDRFGPIVSSDTLWSIAMYYGDKSDLSVYEMMDLFIELNPDVFIDGRADRMMDGFYLKVPKEAQQALADKKAMAAQASSKAEVASSSAATSTQPAASTQSRSSTTTVVETTTTEPATAASSTAAESATGLVTFSVEELTRLRDQLAESTALIERLNTENATLQSRLDDVTRELDTLQKKVNAEQVAENNLQEQIAAEIAATNATAEQPDDTKASASVETIEQTEPTKQEVSTPDVSDSEALVKEQAKQAATQQPEAAQPAAEQPAKPVVKRKQQSDFDAFLEWLMQPFQLTLAILIPLLLATIIWYVLYVRRLNREHLGPYNGALQAAEKDKNEEANQEPQILSAYEEAEQAAAAEEAADMPEFERIDDAVDIDEQANDMAAADEAEQLDNELESLGQDEQSNEAAPQDDAEEADLDTLLSQSFAEEVTETPVEETVLAEPEPEPQAEPESELDNSLEFSVDPEPAVADSSAEPAEKQAKPTADDEDMSLDFVVDQPTSSTTDNTVDLEQFEDINLDDLDLEGLTTENASDGDKDSAQDTDEGYLEIDDLLADADNEDTDFDSSRFEREAGQLDDEETPSGMLDLARAYIELDEYELARAELEKVTKTDDEDAKREAAMLLQKLDEQGH